MPAARHDLRRAAQGEAAPRRVRRRRRDRRQVGARRQGAGRLYGRHAADDQERHLRRERHRARDRLADASLAGRLLRSRQGQDAFVGQISLRVARDPVSRLLARLRVRRQGHRARAHRPPPQAAGDDAADGAARAPIPRSSSRIARRPSKPVDPTEITGMSQEEILNYFYEQIVYKRSDKGWVVEVRPRPHEGHEARRRHDRRQDQQGRGRRRRQDDPAPDQAPAGWRLEGPDRAARGALRHLRRGRHRQREDRPDPCRGRRRGHAADAREAVGRRRQGTAGPGDRPHQCRSLHPQHARGGQEPQPRGGAARHLPRHAPGRAADGRGGRHAAERPVLRLRALRPLGGRPREDEHAPRHRGRRHDARAAQARRARDRQGARRLEGRARRDRRHRQSRQPARPLGRRADGEPVPHRPPAHGARDQGAHVDGRDRFGDAARSHQRQARGGGGARVLRLVAAQPVHGPDQPALGDHAQAAPLRARTGRPDARARRLRGARRASDALRPHLPDRDARGTEYRSHQLARDLCAREQVRLHRDAVPQGREGQGHRARRLLLGDAGDAVHDRPGERAARQERPLRRGPHPVPQGAATS